MMAGGTTGARAVLYAYYLSSCSWRVRAALHWKRIPYDERSVDIRRAKDQLSEGYRVVHPGQKVPALCIVKNGLSLPLCTDGETIAESMAILQYLEDTRPQPSLTPSRPLLKARMREICETIVSGIQPLQNIGLQSHFETDEQFQRFSRHFADRGLQTLEDLVARSAGRYSCGDHISVADLCLVPQVYNSVTRLKLDVSKYPTVSNMYQTLLKEDLFKETHPLTIKARLKDLTK